MKMKKIFLPALCLIFITVAISGATSTPAPKISASPTSVNFGPVALGATPAAKIVTIKNTGTSALTISAVSITGTDSAEFGQTNSCVTIAAGGSCPVSVTFTPATPYTKKTALLAIASNDLKKPLLNVKLSGQVPPPKISATPSSLNFGKVTLGGTSAPKATTIKNTGTADLVIGGINITGANASEFSQTNNCTTITAGGSCVITGIFAPTLTGSAKATITIDSNDPKKPTLNVKVSGNSPAPSSKIISDGSFDNITTYPAPVDITYTRKDGTVGTVNAFPGQVVILANPATSVNTVTTLITQNGGAVAAQIPNIGFYVATISPSALDTFLAAMYASSAVLDAFPNGFVDGSRDTTSMREDTINAASGDASSLIQTIDLSLLIGCGTMFHEDAVKNVAGSNGMDVQINDVTSSDKETTNAGTDYNTVNRTLINILSHAEQNNLPVIINMSLRPKPDNAATEYYFHKHYAMMLDSVAKHYPALLKNAVILISGSDTSLDQTDSFKKLFQVDFPGSAMWNNLYFVESQEGVGPGGCGIGYADIGPTNDMNVMSAPGCHIPVSATCVANGTSFSTPEIANLIAQAFLAVNKKINLGIIAKDLMKYQKNNQGRLPSLTQLVNLAKGGAAIYPESVFFDATGGSGSVTVTAPGGWTATSSDTSWLTVTSGSIGSGSGTVAYDVAENTDTSQRTGTITIKGATFTVIFTVTQTAVIGVTGTWSMTVNVPAMDCTYGGYTDYEIMTLQEDSSGALTGDDGAYPLTAGSRRDGDTLSIHYTSLHGGPQSQTWTWDGANTITGQINWFCYWLDTGQVYQTSSAPFTATRN